MMSRPMNYPFVHGPIWCVLACIPFECLVLNLFKEKGTTKIIGWCHIMPHGAHTIPHATRCHSVSPSFTQCRRVSTQCRHQLFSIHIESLFNFEALWGFHRGGERHFALGLVQIEYIWSGVAFPCLYQNILPVHFLLVFHESYVTAFAHS